MNAKLLIFFLSIPFILRAHYDLAICAIFQNEASFMKEWIDYHVQVGVQHFWLYNNNSTDHYKKVLQPYINEGIVELIEWPSVQEENDVINYSFTVQPGAYTNAIQRSTGKTKWLAIIDLDEFIVPAFGNSVVNILENFFVNESGICVNWQCYGTSHVKKAPEGQMLRHLTLKMKWDHLKNRFFKSIVRPEKVSHCTNPHFVIYLPGFYHVNTIYEPIGDFDHSVNIHLLRINHYWTRDEWFLNKIKIPRYKKWGSALQSVMDEASQMNDTYDPITDYVTLPYNKPVL